MRWSLPLETLWAILISTSQVHPQAETTGRAQADGPLWSPRRTLTREVLGPLCRAAMAVPEGVFRAVAGLQGPGVAPVLRCAPTPAGLSLQLQRPVVFERVLGAPTSYAIPAKPASPGPQIVLHCPALRCHPDTLRLSQLRAVLVADHLARTLRAHGVCVCSVPSVRDPHMATFLQKLRVDWPAASKSTSTETLRTCVLAELNSVSEGETLPPGVLGRVCLKELVEQKHAAGYDPSIDSCLVTEDLLSVLSELQEAVRHWPEGSYPGLDGDPGSGVNGCMVVHVVSCEEAFQQQKLDLLWQKLDDQAPDKQKHLVCGPVKVAGASGTLMTAPEYYKFRHAQVCKASALKHGGDLAQDPAWTETFDVLSVATIKFEMLSTAPQNQGEWLLLFNSVLPFLDLLSQTVSLASTPGLHVPVRTEMVCKFLVQLSMDFSSYYNRVHILGVSIQQKSVCWECGVHTAKTGKQEDEPAPFLSGTSATPLWSDVCPPTASESST
ncbi:DALR anticodon-binding domain-containing protein 3 isoform X4 [Peromyscus maniculatus bairdii]|uniref:DALR anticodon-binding domain-containing protein 3 isoform X4 n=1 Tax=Peromyscus maniculatus bairdii TaxID=230844 RepID=UPI003FD41838